MKARCKNLEIHVAHGCNLTCESCAHFSNQAHTGLLAPSRAEEWFQAWHQRVQPEQFSLLGGEPALNPRLSEIVLLARRYWKQARIILVTNGFLLPRHTPQLPEALAEANAQIHISIHFDSVEYEERLDPVRQLVDNWQDRYAITVHWRKSESHWTRRYHGWGPTTKPFTDEVPRKSWENCPARWCVQLHEGKLWKCPPIAYLPMQKERHGIGEEWDRYLKYQPLDESCTDDELQRFLAREDEDCCAMCPAKPPLFFLPSPLTPVGAILRQISK